MAASGSLDDDGKKKGMMASIEKLPGLNVDPRFISVAGFSAGGFMAMNMHVVFADIIKGAGLGHSSIPASL